MTTPQIMTQKIKVYVRATLDTTYHSTLDIIALDNSERLLRSFKFLGLGLSVTLLSALIPILHFVTVPLGIIISFYLFFKSLKTKLVYKTKELSCPQCKNPMIFKSKPFQWPLKDQCPSCGATIIIEPEEK